VNLQLQQQRYIFDRCGNSYEISVNWAPSALDVAVLSEGTRIGRASLSITNKQATLCEIFVWDGKIAMQSWWRRLMFGWKAKNFRERGLGTQLLNIVLEELRSHDISQLEGEMVGDIPRLSVWYRAAGFETRPDTNRIYRNLG
jgi:GNAT superfamily N-acetyltransferase